MKSKYGFGKSLDLNFDDAIAKVTAELGVEGFGVLSGTAVTAWCASTGLQAPNIR